MIHFDYPCKYMIQIGQMTLFYLGMHGAVYRYLSLFLKIFIKNDNFIFYIARYVLAVAIIYIISRVIIVFCKKYQLERITNYVGLK